MSLSIHLLVLTIFIGSFVVDAQEFKFTASCINSQLTTSTDNKSCQVLNNKFDKLLLSLTKNDKSSLSVSNSTRSVLKDYLLAQKIESLFQRLSPSHIPGSCADIKGHWPHSPSGYYTIATSNGDTTTVYCHMEELCKSKGPWTRIAYLNMSDPTHQCPPGFGLHTSNCIRACGRPSGTSGGCQAQVFFSPPSKGYKEVCGKVIGYQYYSTDAFYHKEGQTIDSHYVDGVSLTYGLCPRKHIWTFASGYSDSIADGSNCPCSSGSPQTVPPFVGNDFFCESGCSESSVSQKLYTSDPLWDGNGCGSLEQDCCNVSDLPWFHKVLTSTTTEALEIRICASHGRNNDEDIPIASYEIYVK